MTEPSLAALAGHDPDAARRITELLTVYRREGLPGLRARAEIDEANAEHAEIVDVIVEAVLTVAEQTSRPTSGRRAWEHFEAEEARIEGAGIRRGGGA